MPGKTAPPAARPAFSFLVCPDSQLLRFRLEDEAKAHPPACGPRERHVYWGDEDPPPRFWEQLGLQGLFGTERIVVVRQAQLWKKDVWEKISRVLARPSAQCWPFFCLEGPWEKGQPKIPACIGKQQCMAFADRQKWIWRNPGLDEKGVRRHFEKRAAEIGLSLTPDAVARICAALPPDAQAVENEVQKLSLLQTAQSRDSDANDAVPSAEAVKKDFADAFACIRHLEAGDLPSLLKELQRTRDLKASFYSLAPMLAREIRMLWQIKVGERVFLPASVLPFKQRLAANLSTKALSQAMSCVVEAEWAIKRGLCDETQSLERLLVRILSFFPRERG